MWAFETRKNFRGEKYSLNHRPPYYLSSSASIVVFLFLSSLVGCLARLLPLSFCRQTNTVSRSLVSARSARHRAQTTSPRLSSKRCCTDTVNSTVLLSTAPRTLLAKSSPTYQPCIRGMSVSLCRNHSRFFFFRKEGRGKKKEKEGKLHTR